jgi:ABC-type multidrug transport system ATPase subunit
VSEAQVRGALDMLMRDRTTIVIAHRLSTVRNADLLAVLDHGRLVETGSHAELLARNGLYVRLIRRQIEGARQPLRAVGKEPEPGSRSGCTGGRKVCPADKRRGSRARPGGDDEGR